MQESKTCNKPGGAAMSTRTNARLTVEDLRVFWLHVVELDDDELQQLIEDGGRETRARIERRRGIARLFFSTVSDIDLDLCRTILRDERDMRARGRRRQE